MTARTYSGSPCSAGHDGTRYVSTRACVECAKAREASRAARPYIAKAERAPGMRTVKAGQERRPAKRSKIQGETPDAARAPSPVAGAAVSTMAGGLLEGATLEGATLEGATLEGATLEGATLEGLDARALGVALAAALEAHGRAHLALTRLDSGLWQAVALRPGYRDQVTRCARDPGEAVRLALTGARGRADELLDVVG